MQKPWLKHYPKGVAETIDVNRYPSVADLFDESVQKFRDHTAFINMGAELTYEDLNYLSADFASFLQHAAALEKGDRVAVMMPNLLQYPIVNFAALRSGLVIVNVNPLYTPRELKHQLIDSGAKVIVVLANVAHTLAEVIKDTPVETIVVTEVGDMLGFPKSMLVNTVVKHVKKMVPDYDLPGAFSWFEAMDLGSEANFVPVRCTGDDLAFLQYTGGTTGVAKGAMLTHQNIVANLLQIAEWKKPLLVPGEEVAVMALPLYHIFSLTVNCLAMMYYGAANLMITNPRDIKDYLKTLRKNRFTVVVGLNTLYNAMMNHPDFTKIDFSNLKISVAGGMALQRVVSERWLELTKTPLVEGFGLTETSPVASCNPIDGTDRVGTIGIPLPSTEIMLCDDAGHPVPIGEQGEICIRGPQVMKGYWQKPEETTNMIDQNGWLHSGDIGIMDADGFTKIVDRKKDMIIVSGFNVYPNEIEEVVSSHPKVLEVAAIGVPDAKSTEVVKIFIVKKDQSLTTEEILAHCKANLTGYKMPKHVEFRKDLPKTNVGKILRRELRDSEARA